MIVIARDDGDDGALLGLAMVRLQPDVFTGEPSAHLETLVVAERSEGAGVGSALIERAEGVARQRGARSITLHVFDTNSRALALYERKGYVREWVRCFKPLDS